MVIAVSIYLRNGYKNKFSFFFLLYYHAILYEYEKVACTVVAYMTIFLFNYMAYLYVYVCV